MERLKRRVYNLHNRWSAVRDKGQEREKEERTLCLYECLRAVGLQRHCARFTSMGVCRASHLSALTMEDYPILGICTMEDRARLFHLVQMVKTDLESLVCEDDDDDYGNEGYAVMDSSLTHDAYRHPNEDVHDHGDDNSVVDNNINAACFARPSCVRRWLDFSCETTDQQKLLYCPKGSAHIYASPNRNYGPIQGKLSTIPVQLELDSGDAAICGSKGSINHRTDVNSHLSKHHTDGNTKPDIIGGTSLYNSHKRLSSKCVSIHKPKPRPATVTTKRFNSKRFGHKDRKGISRKENLCAERGSNEAFRHMGKPTPVYESKRTAGYNYGLPPSSLPTFNRKQAGDQRISVCVRKRPLTHAESRRGEADVVTNPGGECVIVHESKEAVDLTQYILQHRFYFDQVFGEESSNEEVYQSTAYPLVQHMLSGGNATCFAYGQTGAGKTHTMLGSSPRRPGLYALAVRDIFAHLSTTHTLSVLLVYVSFFEIYRGQLYDLLDHRKRLFAREDGQKVVHIAGLRDIRVDSVSSLLEVISQGMGERTQGMSGVNPLSSRSHALLQIQLRGPNQQIAGRMWFVDLAGSERASDTKEPDRRSRMEGAEINQSLLALKECIRSLDQEQSHTPFRQSKLTQVLKDSFVGDSMTCMIANISPGHLATEHTLNTLRYADRVKELRRQGVRAGRRGKTLPSPKHNLSNSNTGGTRGKSPPKKAKLGRQREAFGHTSPTTMLPTSNKIICSTPKNSRWGEETCPRVNKGIGCEHITPVRGWLETVDKREMLQRAGEQKVMGKEIEKTDSHSVSCIKGRAGLVPGQPIEEEVGHNGNLSLTRRESVFSHREKEQNQQSTLKVGREEERKWIEQQKQVESSRHTCREVEMQNERGFKKADKKDKEKESHLRWYHQQLQQFMPTSLPLFSPFQCPSFISSNQASPSSSLSPSSCSSLQQSSYMSLSDLMYHSLDEVLEEHRDRVQVKADDNRRQFPFPSGEICVQPETSSSCKNSNDEDAHGSSDGTGGDQKLHWEQAEARFGQDIGESEMRRSVKAKGKARARNGDKRTAGIEGGERRWAWVATTDTEHPDRMTGAVPNNAGTQVPYNCDSEDRREVVKEGLTASDITADGLWSIKEGGGADSCSLVSSHSNNSNSLLYPSPFELPYQQAPAERPFSPASEHTNTLLTPNKQSDVSSESKNFGCTSNIRPLPLQNTPQAVPSSSHREKEKRFATNASRRQFSNAQSSTQSLTISATQTELKKSAKPINKLYKNPAHTQVHHYPEVKNGETADSLSGIMDPLSISLLQVDQQVTTALFLQEEQNNASVCLQKNDRREDARKKVEEDKLLKTQCSSTSDTVTVVNHTEQRKDMCHASYGHCGIGREKHHIPEDMLVSLQDLEDTQRPQTMQAIEVLGNKAPAQPLNLSTYAVIQSIPPSIQYSNNTGSSGSHNLIPSGTTQMSPQHGHNMYSKSASTISTQQSENILGHLNAVPSQCHTVHSHHFRDSNNSLKPNSPTETNGQETTSNQQIRPIIHLPTLKDMSQAQWCVIRAHWEQLEEMETLCHKEGVLLCQQPDMAFREYIQKLEKIMARKAQCVHSMRAQLQPYLMHHSSQPHNQGEHNNDSVI